MAVCCCRLGVLSYMASSTGESSCSKMDLKTITVMMTASRRTPFWLCQFLCQAWLLYFMWLLLQSIVSSQNISTNTKLLILYFGIAKIHFCDMGFYTKFTTINLALYLNFLKKDLMFHWMQPGCGYTNNFLYCFCITTSRLLSRHTWNSRGQDFIWKVPHLTD